MEFPAVTMHLSHSRQVFWHGRGFSLLELMVALTLGLFLVLGIVSVFSDVSATNRMQNSVARLQENGRFALTRMTQDLRMLSGQYCSSTDSSTWIATHNGGVYTGDAITVNVDGVSSLGSNGAFPDSGGSAGRPPAGWTSGHTYPLTPATFIAAYTCSLSGGCVPQVPGQSPAAVDGLPAEGTTAGTRIKGADVLTVRYQNGSGWPFEGSLASITLAPAAANTSLSIPGDDPINFAASGDRALLTRCGGGVVIKVDRAGTLLSPTSGSLESPSVAFPAGGSDSFDDRVFNFSRDFVTVTYYLLYKADPNVSGRVIPTLVRRLNGGIGNAQSNGDEVVEGVERFNVSFGVQYADGTFRYLSAAEVVTNSSAATCPRPVAAWDPSLYGDVEPDCLWRAVQSVQINLLLDTVDNQYDLSDSDLAYRYSIDGPGRTVPPAASQPMSYNGVNNGSAAGRMLRREFIGVVNTRNNTH